MNRYYYYVIDRTRHLSEILNNAVLELDGGVMGRVCEKQPQKNVEFSTYLDSIAMGLKHDFRSVGLFMSNCT